MGLVLRNPKAPCSISSLDRKRPLGRVKWAVLVGCLGGVEWKIQEAVPLRFLNSDPKCCIFVFSGGLILLPASSGLGMTMERWVV